jgi:hypothetical protein
MNFLMLVTIQFCYFVVDIGSGQEGGEDEEYIMFQKSFYRKARYKNHLPLKYCLQKLFKMRARVFLPPLLHSHETCFSTFKQVSTGITVRTKVELLFSSR